MEDNGSMNKTKIEWTDYTWNPITGCLHGCDYCYARKIAERFPKAFPQGFAPAFHQERLQEPIKLKKPSKIFTVSMGDMFGDGLPAYHDAFNKEYYSNTKPQSTHINVIKITNHDSAANNNKMERINGEIRDREKVMRGLKKRDTAIIDGMQVYHNFIKPHEGLGGATPAEACGIVVSGENKWMTLIQNAARAK